MNEKEKKAALKLWQISCALENSIKRAEYDEKYSKEVLIEEYTEEKEAIKTVLNLIEKQQAELETLKRDFEIVDHECSRLEKEDIKKDKIIDFMATAISNYDSQLAINTYDHKEHVKEVFEEYYNYKIEKGE